MNPDAKHLAEWIAPRRAALLIIDMQRDFADVPGGDDALDHAAQLADAARAAGVACIFAGMQTRPQTDSPVWRAWLERRGRDPDKDLNLCREDSPGAQFVGPQPEPGEMVVAKRRYSAFSGTALDVLLRERGIDTLVVCGLTTEWCVAASARDAFERDVHVFVVRDACADETGERHEAALAALERQCAIIVQSRDILAAWSGSSPNKA